MGGKRGGRAAPGGARAPGVRLAVEEKDGIAGGRRRWGRGLAHAGERLSLAMRVGARGRGGRAVPRTCVGVLAAVDEDERER